MWNRQVYEHFEPNGVTFREVNDNINKSLFLLFYSLILPPLAHSVHNLDPFTSLKDDFDGMKRQMEQKVWLRVNIMSNSLVGNEGIVLVIWGSGILIPPIWRVQIVKSDGLTFIILSGIPVL